MMTHPAVRDGRVRMQFYVARSGDSSVDSKVDAERVREADLVVLGYKEDYRKIAWKTLAIMVYGGTNVTAGYVMKCDDDSFLHLDRVVGMLEERDRGAAGKALFWGMLAVSGEKPHRDPSNPW